MDFWPDFLSNLLATLIGFGLGIPFALWLDRRSRHKDDDSKLTEKRARAVKILTVLKDELTTNRTSLNRFSADLANNLSPIHMDAWVAFADGGELQYLDDPEMVGSLANSYSMIRHYKFLYEQFIHSYFFQGSVGNTNLRILLLHQVDASRPLVMTEINACLSRLEKVLTARDSDG